jgi:predicted RNA binding protein YcfA (HicA-like mRNA interferase family)
LSPKYPNLKPREIVRALKKMGFYEHHQSGSHLQLKHKERLHVRVTVPIHARAIKISVLKSILKQAEITIEDLNKYT